MIPNSGLNLIRSFLAGSSPTAPNNLAVGTGTTAEAAGDTALETEVGNRQPVTTKTSDNGVIDFIATLPATEGNLGNLSEVGLLNAAASGILFSRIVYAANNFDGNSNFKYTIRHTQTDV